LRISKCVICEKGMCQVCTRECIVCEEERCSRCCVEESGLWRYALIGRGEDGDPVCVVCRVENKLGDDDTSEGSDDETEMAQNGP
jgi:hypothetical protein